MWTTKLILVILLIPYAISNAKVNNTLKKEAKKYLKYVDKVLTSFTHGDRLISWAYETNVTDENLKKMEDYEAKGSNMTYKFFPWREFKDADMLRQATLYKLLFTKETVDDAFRTEQEMQSVIYAMVDVYSTLTICSYKNRSICNVVLFPDLIDLFKVSRDPDELEYYFTEYHNKLSLGIKQNFSKYIKLGNKHSQFFNYSNRGEMWITQEYESPPYAEFENVMNSLYNQLKPLYLELHAFIRGRLYDFYGECVVNKTGPIPAHLMGTITGKAFQNIIDIIKPYPNKTSIDITKQLVKKNYTTTKMAALCDDFYRSLGLPPMPELFWKNSQFEKPKDRESTCTITAWDMFDKNHEDLRLLACSNVNMDDLMGFCHEIGHLQYAIGAKNLPFCYKDNKINPAINEGWADVTGLSMSTIKYLSKLGLIEDVGSEDPEVNINNLFYNAVEKIAFLPYGLIVDMFRWHYFKGEITDDNSNTEWWKMRLDYQGIAPPKPRSDKYLDIFDKVHVLTDTPYCKYFLAHVVQYQIQESLCVAAQQYDPKNPKSQSLDKCNIYGSKEAGKLLKNMFALGASKPWLDILKTITGQSKLDATPISNYYATLYEWLKKENKKLGNAIGW